MIIGIDLAGSEKRNTGFCLLSNNSIDKTNKKTTNVEILYSDKQILDRIKKFKTKIKIIAIDAPLSLPKGRKNIDDRNNVHFRQCDLGLRKLGIKFFPITLGPMRMLTKRGMKLKQKIEKISKRIKVIEIYPGASYDVFGLDRKNKQQIIKFMKKFVKITRRSYTQDELDAVCAAITGKFYLHKKAVILGNKIDGEIVIPKIHKWLNK